MINITATEFEISTELDTNECAEGNLALMLQYSARAMRAAKRGDLKEAATCARLAAGFGHTYEEQRKADIRAATMRV